MTIKTEEPKHSEKLLGAVENTLKAHNLRLKPGQDLTTVVESLESRGVKLSAENGYLSASQTTAGAEQAMHVNQVIEGLAKQEADKFFPREVGGVRSKDEMDTAGKIQYIREHGEEAFRRLPLTAPKETVTVLDKSRLTRAQYLSLDRATRAQLAGQWGPNAIGQIMARVK